MSHVITYQGKVFDETTSPWSVVKVRLDRQGYDIEGSYWGVGENLYLCLNDSETQYIRAKSRQEAIYNLESLYPNSKLNFYRRR